MGASGRRIILNAMIELGARSVSFMEIELRHIVLTDRGDEIIVPRSKGGRYKKAALPVTPLWAANEIRHLREFMAWLSETGRYDASRRLTELAGFGRSPGPGRDEAVRAALASYVKKVGVRFSTHLPRINFATWFPIRCLAAHHRWLLDEEILACCRNDPWFTEEALDRLKALYPSETYSVIETCRRVLMQAGYKEFVTRYCRSLPILLKLWANPRLREEM